MKSIYLIFKNLSLSVVACLGAFIVYANWQKPSLAESMHLKPIQLCVFSLEGSVSSMEEIKLSRLIERQKGVTAVALNEKYHTLSITYHPEQISDGRLRKLVELPNMRANKIDFSAVNAPQCPVPVGFIDFLAEAKNTFCFR